MSKRVFHLLKHVVGGIAMLPLLVACDIESSDNGKLDGFWHLERIDTLRTGGVADLSACGVFWAIEAKLLCVNDIDHKTLGRYYFRFSQTTDSLIIHTPYLNKGHEDTWGGDIPVTDALVLAPFGISALEEHYLKEKLDGSSMILRSSTYRLWFRRF